MMHKSYIFTLLFVLLVAPSLVSAETEYANIGGTDNDFLQGVGGFSGGVLTTTQNRPLTRGTHIPLVSDLDEDGINEIIVIDHGQIRLFQNTSLTALDIISIPDGQNFDYSPPTIFDIDEDGLHEIMIVGENTSTAQIRVFQWDGSDLTLDFNVTQSAMNTKVHGGSDAIIGCGTVFNRSVCMIASVEQSPFFARAQAFNRTHVGASFGVAIGAPTAICFPRVAVMTVADYDNDGTNEFIYSFIFADNSGDEEYFIEYLSIDDTFAITEENQVTITQSVSNTFNSAQCNLADNDGLLPEDLLTSPLLVDVNGGGGLETIIGYMTANDEFKMNVYSETTAALEDHPEFTTADGQLLGNVMPSHVFGDTGNIAGNIFQDYCVFGFHETDSEITLLCGSLLTGHSPSNNIEFSIGSPTSFNYSRLYGTPSTIAHMNNMQEENIDVGDGFIDTTEFTVAHGVYGLTSNSFFGLGDFDLERVFPIDTERQCVLVDYEQIGASDLVCVSGTAVTYLNDGLVNGVAAISEHTENPCIDAGVVGVNSTFQVELTAVDQNDFPLDQDKVSTRVTLYSGVANAQISEIGNQTSGDEVIHLFEFPAGGINLTGNVNLKYEAWDTAHPSIIDTINQAFTVGNAGNVFGDCTSSTIIELVEAPAAPEDVLAAAIPDDDVDNAITNTVVELNALSGLGGFTLWLFMMIVISLGIWSAAHAGDISGSAALGTIAIVNVLLLFLGAQLGIIGTGIIIIVTLIGVVILGIFLGKFITGMGSGDAR